jgi:hypothetical protein
MDDFFNQDIERSGRSEGNKVKKKEDKWKKRWKERRRQKCMMK